MGVAVDVGGVQVSIMTSRVLARVLCLDAFTAAKGSLGLRPGRKVSVSIAEAGNQVNAGRGKRHKDPTDRADDARCDVPGQ